MLSIGRERLGLTTKPVQTEHQDRASACAGRCGGEESLCLRYCTIGIAGRQERFEPRLVCCNRKRFDTGDVRCQELRAVRSAEPTTTKSACLGQPLFGVPPTAGCEMLERLLDEPLVFVEVLLRPPRQRCGSLGRRQRLIAEVASGDAKKEGPTGLAPGSLEATQTTPNRSGHPVRQASRRSSESRNRRRCGPGPPIWTTWSPLMISNGPRRHTRIAGSSDIGEDGMESIMPPQQLPSLDRSRHPDIGDLEHSIAATEPKAQRPRLRDVTTRKDLRSTAGNPDCRAIESALLLASMSHRYRRPSPSRGPPPTRGLLLKRASRDGHRQ